MIQQPKLLAGPITVTLSGDLAKSLRSVLETFSEDEVLQAIKGWLDWREQVVRDKPELKGPPSVFDEKVRTLAKVKAAKLDSCLEFGDLENEVLLDEERGGAWCAGYLRITKEEIEGPKADAAKPEKKRKS